MPNYCDYEARLKGKKKDVLKLAEWMGAYYTYREDRPKCYTCDPQEGGVPTEHHIGWRIFEAYHEPELISDYEDDETVVYTVSGYCAWSCYSCMLEGPLTYYTDNNKADGKENLSLSLPEACKMLAVEVELFSYECGYAFAENFHIGSDGLFLTNKCVDYAESCIGDYKTYDDMKKDYGNHGWECHISEELFEEAKAKNCDYVSHCEFFKDNVSFDYEWPFVLDM